MGYASSGTTCPLCGKYASIRRDQRLYVHPGSISKLIGTGFQECRASGATWEQAKQMADNRAAGRHFRRNADGSWIELP